MRVFISHSSEDTWVALRMAEAIRGTGAGTFLDRHDIAHGDRFEEEIRKGEANCDEQLVLLTPRSMLSTWIALEMAFFRHSRKRIVLVRHGVTNEGIASAAVLPPFSRELDTVHLNDFDSYFRQLAQRADPGERP